MAIGTSQRLQRSPGAAEAADDARLAGQMLMHEVEVVLRELTPAVRTLAERGSDRLTTPTLASARQLVEWYEKVSSDPAFAEDVPAETMDDFTACLTHCRAGTTFRRLALVHWLLRACAELARFRRCAVQDMAPATLRVAFTRLELAHTLVLRHCRDNGILTTTGRGLQTGANLA